MLLQNTDVGQRRIDQIEFGQRLCQKRGIREPGVFVLRRDARHRDRAFGERIRAVALQVVGRDHRLLAADQHAQADIVAFGAFGLLDVAVAHLDRERDRAHRDGVGGIGAGLARGLDQAFGKRDERGLIEKV